MKTLDIIKFGSTLLKKNEIVSHILDSEILLSKTLKKTREEMLSNLDKKINSENISIFKEYIERRSRNEPIAYILEKTEKEKITKKSDEEFDLMNEDKVILSDKDMKLK